MRHTLYPIILLALLLPCTLQAFTFNLTATVHSNSVCGNSIKEAGEQCDGSDFGGLTCSASGFTGGSLACTSSCQLAFAACTTDANTALVHTLPAQADSSYTFGNSSESSTTISMDRYTYPDDLTFEAFLYEPAVIDSIRPAPAGLDFAGRVHSLYFLSADGSVVHNLNKPVKIEIQYSDKDVSSFDPASLSAYKMDDGDASWQKVPGSRVDTARKVVTFYTNTFSWFAVFGSPPVASPVTVNSSNNSMVISGAGGGLSSGIAINGAAEPQSTVYLLVDSRLVAMTKSLDDGSFSFMQGLPSGSYSIGVYEENSRGYRSPLQTVSVRVTAGRISSVDGLVIAAADIPVRSGGSDKQPAGLKTDLNNDGKINIVDFSIMSYWYGRAHPPASVDLNNDGRVNLVDFSILSYYWTG